MQSQKIEITKMDQRAINQLASFIPDQIFDAHAHLYDCAFAPHEAAPGSIFYRCVDVVSVPEYRRLQGPLYGENKEIRLNIVTLPDQSMTNLSNGHRDASTHFLFQQLSAYPHCVGEIFVLPDDRISDIEAQLIHPNIRGFKCYHSSALRKPTWQSGIGDYLPESAWEVANDRGLCITLHMVKDHALSDPDNLDYIRTMCHRYQEAKLILAHCARGFSAWTVMESVEYLKEYQNVYFDISAICESPAIYSVIKYTDVKRVLWGSDFPVSMIRGKCISLAEHFLWLDKEKLDDCQYSDAEEMTLVGIESLLAFKQAAHMLELSKSDIEHIFYDNAMRLFRLEN